MRLIEALEKKVSQLVGHHTLLRRLAQESIVLDWDELDPTITGTLVTSFHPDTVLTTSYVVPGDNGTTAFSLADVNGSDPFVVGILVGSKLTWRKVR